MVSQLPMPTVPSPLPEAYLYREYQDSIISDAVLQPGYWAGIAKRPPFPRSRRQFQKPGTLLYSMKALPALREPTLRVSHTDKPNWPPTGSNLGFLVNQKIQNIEALLAQVVSPDVFEGDAACSNCRTGDGLYTVCVRVPGQNQCANCHHGRQGSRCSFQQLMDSTTETTSPTHTDATDATNTAIAMHKLEVRELQDTIRRLQVMLSNKVAMILVGPVLHPVRD